MPSYFRFPETETIQQRFWGCRPINPTCGWIGLEKGAKIFAWFYIISSAFLVALCALTLTLPLWAPSHDTHHDLLHQLKASQSANGNKKDVDTWVEKLNTKQSLAVRQTILFLFFLMFSVLLYISWKLKKAIVERDESNLKKYFYCILVFNIILYVPYIFETERLTASALLFDLPFMVVEIMGLMFTHAFIVSLSSSENGQHDDMNRIQFSP